MFCVQHTLILFTVGHRRHTVHSFDSTDNTIWQMSKSNRLSLTFGSLWISFLRIRSRRVINRRQTPYWLTLSRTSTFPSWHILFSCIYLVTVEEPVLCRRVLAGAKTPGCDIWQTLTEWWRDVIPLTENSNYLPFVYKSSTTCNYSKCIGVTCKYPP